MMDDFCVDAEAAGRHDLSENAAGQIVEMFDEARPAAEIVTTMVEQCVETLDALAQFRNGRQGTQS
jgi:NAD(P)H-dependent flavin oxidoreductase YrpB (nitropropane dioxygenase family)